MKSILSKAFLVLLLAVALFVARSNAPADADPRSSVAMPVQSLDSNNNILGTATNPAYFVVGSPADGGASASSTTVAGAVGIMSDAGQTIAVTGLGSAGSPSGGVVSVQGVSGGTAAPSDPTTGDFLNTRYVSNVAITSAVVLDAGTTAKLIACRFYNAGALTAFEDIFCGQAALDAGGTADAGTAPSVQVPCPAGTVCDWQMPSSTTCGPGAAFYPSSTVGLLTVDAGQQASTAECVYR